MQGHHLARVPVVQGVNGVKPETGGKDPIEGRGGTTSLHMTQDGGARLFGGPPCDLLLQKRPDADEPLMSERVDLMRRAGIVPSIGNAPSATTTIGAYWLANRRSMNPHTSSIENGLSGIRITFAPPAMPECKAIQPE